MSRDFDPERIVLKHTEGSVRLDDRPGVLAVIGRDNGVAAASNGDIEIAYPWLGHGEDAVALAPLRRERLNDGRLALGDAADHGLRGEAAHPVLGAAEEGEARHVAEGLARNTKAPVAANPRAADADWRKGRLIGRGDGRDKVGGASGVRGGGTAWRARSDRRWGGEHGGGQSVGGLFPGAPGRRIAADRGQPEADEEQQRRAEAHREHVPRPRRACRALEWGE